MKIIRDKSREWIRPLHDARLIKYVNDLDYDNCTIGRLLGFPMEEVYIHAKRLNLTLRKRVPKTVFKPEAKRPTPAEKPNPLELGKIFIPGFDPETMCIHYKHNRIERLPMDKLITRPKDMGVM